MQNANIDRVPIVCFRKLAGCQMGLIIVKLRRYKTNKIFTESVYIEQLLDKIYMLNSTYIYFCHSLDQFHKNSDTKGIFEKLLLSIRNVNLHANLTLAIDQFLRPKKQKHKLKTEIHSQILQNIYLNIHLSNFFRLKQNYD